MQKKYSDSSTNKNTTIYSRNKKNVNNFQSQNKISKIMKNEYLQQNEL